MEHPEPRGSELHDAEVIGDLPVGGQLEADSVGVERLGAIDVGDGHDYELEGPIHDPSPFR